MLGTGDLGRSLTAVLCDALARTEEKCRGHYYVGDSGVCSSEGKEEHIYVYQEWSGVCNRRSGEIRAQVKTGIH